MKSNFFVGGSKFQYQICCWNYPKMPPIRQFLLLSIIYSIYVLLRFPFSGLRLLLSSTKRCCLLLNMIGWREEGGWEVIESSIKSSVDKCELCALFFHCERNAFHVDLSAGKNVIGSLADYLLIRKPICRKQQKKIDAFHRFAEKRNRIGDGWLIENRRDRFAEKTNKFYCNDFGQLRFSQTFSNLALYREVAFFCSTIQPSTIQWHSSAKRSYSYIYHCYLPRNDFFYLQPWSPQCEPYSATLFPSFQILSGTVINTDRSVDEFAYLEIRCTTRQSNPDKHSLGTQIFVCLCIRARKIFTQISTIMQCNPGRLHFRHMIAFNYNIILQRI